VHPFEVWLFGEYKKECKQYLRLGKCESPDFDAQIVATTLSLLQYNLFSTGTGMKDVRFWKIYEIKRKLLCRII
jgi:hypothetical protein